MALLSLGALIFGFGLLGIVADLMREREIFRKGY
jgi:hypothetical protein